MRAATYTLQKIPPLPGCDHMGATALNNLGHVVGYAIPEQDGSSGSTPDGIPSAGNAFFWRGTDPVALKGFGLESVALGINDRGNVVGAARERVRPSDGKGFSFHDLFRDDGVVPWPVLWERPDAPPLRLSGVDRGVAWAINEKRQIVGNRAALWRPDARGRMVHQQLGTPKVGRLVGINRRGQMIGYRSVYITEPNFGESGQSAFWGQSGRWSPLATRPEEGEATSKPHALNAAGVVVGWVGTERREFAPMPYLWKQGKGEPLSELEGAARGINDAGVIVGWCSLTPRTRFACLWQGGKPINLSDFATGDANFLEAVAINNRGQILVNGFNGKGEAAYLLTPK